MLPLHYAYLPVCCNVATLQESRCLFCSILSLPLVPFLYSNFSTHKSKNDQKTATMDEGTSICSDSHRCENYSICIEYPNNEGLVSGGVDGGCKSRRVVAGLPVWHNMCCLGLNLTRLFCVRSCRSLFLAYPVLLRLRCRYIDRRC